jgi:hypothetical protein
VCTAAFTQLEALHYCTRCLVEFPSRAAALKEHRCNALAARRVVQTAVDLELAKAAAEAARGALASASEVAITRGKGRVAATAPVASPPPLPALPALPSLPPPLAPLDAHDPSLPPPMQQQLFACPGCSYQGRTERGWRTHRQAKGH